jgi:hypothetical protein
MQIAIRHKADMNTLLSTAAKVTVGSKAVRNVDKFPYQINVIFV